MIETGSSVETSLRSKPMNCKEHAEARAKLGAMCAGRPEKPWEDPLRKGMMKKELLEELADARNYCEWWGKARVNRGSPDQMQRHIITLLDLIYEMAEGG